MNEEQLARDVDEMIAKGVSDAEIEAYIKQARAEMAAAGGGYTPGSQQTYRPGEHSKYTPEQLQHRADVAVNVARSAEEEPSLAGRFGEAAGTMTAGAGWLPNLIPGVDQTGERAVAGIRGTVLPLAQGRLPRKSDYQTAFADVTGGIENVPAFRRAAGELAGGSILPLPAIGKYLPPVAKNAVKLAAIKWLGPKKAAIAAHWLESRFAQAAEDAEKATLPSGQPQKFGEVALPEEKAPSLVRRFFEGFKRSVPEAPAEGELGGLSRTEARRFTLDPADINAADLRGSLIEPGATSVAAPGGGVARAARAAKAAPQAVADLSPRAPQGAAEARAGLEKLLQNAVEEGQAQFAEPETNDVLMKAIEESLKRAKMERAAEEAAKKAARAAKAAARRAATGTGP